MRSHSSVVNGLLAVPLLGLLVLAAIAALATRVGGTGAPPAPFARPAAVAAARGADELGRIPILVYHEIGDTEKRWQRSRERFRADLQLLHDRGYRPVGIGELLDGRIHLDAGLSPVVVTFDDASPSQFGYVEEDGVLRVDPGSALAIWLDFARTHPEWRNRAVFCVLTAADAGHAMFGGGGIEGQRTEWRHAKLRHLVELGFELCGHTATHANLGRLDSAAVAAHIARGLAAIDSAVPGARVRAFAVPFGAWPVARGAVHAGHWRDPASSNRVVEYHFDAILEGWGGTARSPFDPAFDPLRLPRVQVTGNLLERTLDRLDRDGRYTSDGDPGTIAELERLVPLEEPTVRGGHAVAGGRIDRTSPDPELQESSP